MATIKGIEDVRRKPAVGRDGGEFVIGNVHHFRALNYRLEYGKESDRKATRSAIANYGGWDPSKTIDGENPLPSQKALAIDERREFHKLLQAEAARESSEQASFIRQLEIFEYPGAGFMDAEGRYLPPLQIGITGNRRTSVFIEAMVPVLMDKERAPDGVRSMNFAVPVNVPTNITETIQVPVDKDGFEAMWVGGHYVRDAGGAHIDGGSYVDSKQMPIYCKDGKVVDGEGKAVKGYTVKDATLYRFDSSPIMQRLRGEIQLRENTAVTAGFLEPSDAETLIGVRKITANGGIQADVRRHFADSESVKALRFWFANKIAELDVLKKWGMGLFTRWTDKPYVNDNPAAHPSLAGKPTVEPTYTVGQGDQAREVANRKNPNFLLFKDFSQFAFQGIDPKVTDAPDELQPKVPVGPLAVAALLLNPEKELESINEARKKKDWRPVGLLTKSTLEKWVEYFSKGGKVTVARMSDKAMETWGGKLQSMALRAALNAVLNNKPELADAAEERAELTNAAMAMDLEAYGSLSKSIDKLAMLDPERQRNIVAAIANLLEGETVTVPVEEETVAE